MIRRLIGIIGVLLGSLAILGERMQWEIPTARWFFNASRKLPWLHSSVNGEVVPWFGWVSAVLLISCGLWLIIRSLRGGPRDPVTMRRFRRFRAIKRGYYSLWILIGLALLASLDQALVGKRALAVKYENQWRYPAFLPQDLKYRDFGLDGDAAEQHEVSPESPADYRKLRRIFRETGAGEVILPLVPFDPTGDTLPPRSRALVDRDGVLYESGSRKPFWGLAARYHDVAEGKIHLRFTVRDGKANGPVDGWDVAGTPVFSGEAKDGEILLTTARYNPDSERKPLLTQDEYLAMESSELRAVKYHPAPPLPETRNWLGTTSQGYDVLAYLYGGLQVNFKAALIYLPIVYLIGISIGMLMGYFGGWFDITVQRLIEIFSNMPLLFVVIIFSSNVPDRFKGLPVILTILILFGWMGMTYLMRTAAYRDKQRDYIAAARVLGAGTPRVIFRHLLPNTVAILVTLIPFTMSDLIFSLTSLDYLGFGLPPEYATWGRLLNDGLANLSAPWLVSATFVVLVGLLVLITFVGEAVREAFDPKTFTYYK
jgi:microcin C transport system permease protein